MKAQIEHVPGTQTVSDTVDELVIDARWVAACDQVLAALCRARSPVSDWSMSTELAAEWFGGAR